MRKFPQYLHLGQLQGAPYFVAKQEPSWPSWCLMVLNSEECLFWSSGQSILRNALERRELLTSCWQKNTRKLIIIDPQFNPLFPFLTRSLAGPPESKVDLGRSAVWCTVKTSTDWLCRQTCLFNWDLEAQQSMVTMPDGPDSEPIQEKQVLGKIIWIPLCLSSLCWVEEMLIWPIFSIMRPIMIKYR